MDTLLQDLTSAARSLVRSRGFTFVAVVTLALGIGANTAIFSVINAVLLKPLPYAQPDALVVVHHFYPSLGNLRASVSAPGFRDYSARRDVFAHAAVENAVAINLTGAGEPERVLVSQVSGDFFTTLGVTAALGRTLRPDEAQAGHDHVAVLADAYWRRKFGGDRAVVGGTVRLNGEDYAIVGVMPASFTDYFNPQAGLWAPLTLPPAAFGDDRRTQEFLPFVGRLAPGVTVGKAQAEMHTLASRLKAAYPNSYLSDWDLQVTSLNEEARGGVRRTLLVLLGAVGLVLLIGCANVANLQLARLATRSRELSLRVALGASARRLVGQRLTESILIAAAGALLGLLLAAWGVPALLALSPGGLQSLSALRPDVAVLTFTALVALLTGLLLGLVPALQIGHAGAHEVLKEGGRGAVSDRRSLRLRRGLVVVTIAVALTLLSAAGLLVRSFSRLLSVDPGFEADHLLTFSVALPDTKYPNDTVRAGVLDRIHAAIGATPGVVAAGGTTLVPFDAGMNTGSFTVEGYQVPPGGSPPWGDQRVVTPDYFAAIRAPLKAGRPFGEADRSGAQAVCIVDEALARRFWPNRDPLGKRIAFVRSPSDADWITVVGVVGHILHGGFDDDPSRPQLYLPLTSRRHVPVLGFVVRTLGDPMAVLGALRNAVHGVDADLPLARIATMRDLMTQTTGSRRFALALLAGFAVLAVALALIGLFGVMSYVVAQRTRELGVRLALGAAPRDILGIVLWEGARLSLLGAGGGLLAALLLTRLMRGMLFGVSATDPVTFAVTPVLLVGVALLASALPALRATRLDPIAALRSE